MLTQNVDGFHRQAGSGNVIDIHARLAGKPAVEINPRDPVISHEVGVELPVRAVEALDALWDLLRRT